MSTTELVAKCFIGGLAAAAGAALAVALLLWAARKAKAAYARRRGWTAADEVLYRVDTAAARAAAARAEEDRQYEQIRGDVVMTVRMLQISLALILTAATVLTAGFLAAVLG